MSTLADLNSKIVSAQAIFDSLALKMAQLQVAQRSGNLDRIYQAAMAASNAATDLDKWTGDAAFMASELDATAWDIAHPAAQPFEVV